MVDMPKIGIVYRERAPQFCETGNPDGVPDGMLWKVDLFPESAVLACAGMPLKDYLAVFFSAENETPEIQRYVANMFPGAEIVGYRNSDLSSPGELTKREDGHLVVALPMPCHLARYLLESLAASKAQRRELTSLQMRLGDARDFFDAFVDTIESASDEPDRKLSMSLLIDKILSHVRAEECVLYLLGDGSVTLQRAYSTGNIKDIDLFEQRANSSIIETVWNSGDPYVNNSYSFELRVPFGKESVFIRSILCYPLVRRGEKIGIIELINKIGGAFTREDAALIETMLDPLSVAIRTANRFEDADRLTITDDLTQLYNYRYLMKYLEADVKRCLRYKKKVSLLFIDIDGFKRINDTFGHLAGSQALAEMGQVFKRIVRETDVVGRYGGDEFVIVLPETPLNGALAIAERIRKKVEECEFVAQNLSIRLTVSLGVANCPKHTLTAEGLIKKADAAMYRAKELSKNSIKVAV
ncbi:MAG: response receiver-modulated diguanylate cyclase [Acidobacteria bacterium]|nr:response receiver-modulated diguanylate cyclase [Acidobacteriota bacterium]